MQWLRLELGALADGSGCATEAGRKTAERLPGVGVDKALNLLVEAVYKGSDKRQFLAMPGEPRAFKVVHQEYRGQLAREAVGAPVPRQRLAGLMQTRFAGRPNTERLNSLSCCDAQLSCHARNFGLWATRSSLSRTMLLAVFRRGHAIPTSRCARVSTWRGVAAQVADLGKRCVTDCEEPVRELMTGVFDQLIKGCTMFAEPPLKGAVSNTERRSDPLQRDLPKRQN